MLALDSRRTMLMPSAPVNMKAENPFGNSVGAEARGEVGLPLKLKLDEEEDVGVRRESGKTLLEGMIPLMRTWS